jgi:hypothetical protein
MAAGALTPLLTDADGRFATERRETFRSVHFTVGKEDWAGLAERRAGPFDAIELLAVPAAAITGRVVDARGEPVPGAEVRVSLDGALEVEHAGEAPDEATLAPYRGQLDSPRVVRALADDTGSFRLSPLPWWRTFVVEASSSGEAVARQVQVRGPASVAHAELVVGAGGAAVISGRLALDGVPATGEIDWVGPTTAGRVDVGADGHYRLRLPEAGRIELTAIPRADVDGQRLPSAEVFDDDQLASLDVPFGGAVVHDFELAVQRGAFAGRVTTASGSPVSAHRVVGRGRSDVALTLTDESGSFEVDLATCGQPVELVLSYGEATFRQEAARPTSGIGFVVPELGRLRYRVVDLRNRAVAGALVSWRREADTRFERLSGAPEEGGWRAIEAVAGSFDIAATAPDSGLRVAYRRDLELGLGGLDVEIVQEPGVDLSLELVEAAHLDGHRLYLVPADAWDDVSEGRLDRAWRDGAARWLDLEATRDGTDGHAVGFLDAHAVHPGEDGRATLRGLAPGPHRFRAFPDDLDLVPETIDVGRSAGPVVVEVRADP